MRHWLHKASAIATLGTLLVQPAWSGTDRVTEFTNRDSIMNTRHNLTQRDANGNDLLSGPPNSGGAAQMDPYRNNYGEVCVYCHTPHGANTNVDLPLWNRTIKATTYTTYDQLNTTTLTPGAVAQPGVNSLSCLSCHDGQTAIDSIINMPGSGKYAAGQMTDDQTMVGNPATLFLDTWDGFTRDHSTIADPNGVGCMSCHSPGKSTAATDFTVFYIGTDLRNDHPVGVNYPTANSDFRQGMKTQGVAKYFDLISTDNRMGKDEIRIYNDRVECASCHDPHGVPSAGVGSQFNPTFLRVSNASSGVCLTCHIK